MKLNSHRNFSAPCLSALGEFHNAVSLDEQADHSNRQTLWEKLYPNRPYNEGTLRNTISQYNKYLRHQLIIQELESNERLKSRLLADAYAKSLQTKDFEKLFRKYHENIQAHYGADRYAHLEQYLMFEKYYHYAETNRREIGAPYIDSMVNSLDHFFVLSKLHQAIVVGSRAVLLGKDAPALHFMDSIKSFIQKLPKKESHLMHILYKTAMFFKDPKEEEVKKVYESLRKNHHLFSDYDKHLVMVALVNQMNQYLTKGKMVYLNRIYKVYKLAIEENFVVHGGRISVIGFLNIINIAIRSNDLKMAHQMVEKFAEYLPPEEKEFGILLAESTIGSETSKFANTRAELMKWSKRGTSLDIRFRFTLTKIYIDLAMHQPENLKWIQSYINGTEKFIERQLKNNQEPLLMRLKHFIEVVQLLLKEIKKGTAFDKHLLNHRIQKLKPIAGKSWLLQKVRELGSK